MATLSYWGSHRPVRFNAKPAPDQWHWAVFNHMTQRRLVLRPPTLVNAIKTLARRSGMKAHVIFQVLQRRCDPTDEAFDPTFHKAISSLHDRWCRLEEDPLGLELILDAESPVPLELIPTGSNVVPLFN